MGWSGSDFQRTHNFSADASAGINILASRMDAEFDNFATGLEACLLKSGDNAPEADFAMGGYKHTNVGAATSVNQYLRLDQFQKNTPIFAVYTGTSDAIQASVVPAYTALVTGHAVLVSVTSANTTTSVTLAVNGLSAYPVRNPDSAPLATGAVQGLHQYVFNGSAWILMGGKAGTQGTTEFTGALNVSATATFTQTVRVCASTELHGPLAVSGSATLDAIKVEGSAEFTGPISVSATAVFTQPVQFDASATFTGNVSFTGQGANLVPVATVVLRQTGNATVSVLNAFPSDVTCSAVGSVGLFEVVFPSGNGPGANDVVIANAILSAHSSAAHPIHADPYSIGSTGIYIRTAQSDSPYPNSNCERIWLIAYKIV